MYVIIIYDVEVERLNKVRQILREYLNWVQNSAFEGEISEGKLEEIRLRLKKVIDEGSDSILIYTIPNKDWVSKKIWGIEKGETTTVI
ncbi:MAG: CRISPR-associated endonuclease Cas2 [Nitrososphaerales archaeon]